VCRKKIAKESASPEEDLKDPETSALILKMAKKKNPGYRAQLLVRTQPLQES